MVIPLITQTPSVEQSLPKPNVTINSDVLLTNNLSQNNTDDMSLAYLHHDLSYLVSNVTEAIASIGSMANFQLFNGTKSFFSEGNQQTI